MHFEGKLNNCEAFQNLMQFLNNFFSKNWAKLRKLNQRISEYLLPARNFEYKLHFRIYKSITFFMTFHSSLMEFAFNYVQRL